MLHSDNFDGIQLLRGVVCTLSVAPGASKRDDFRDPRHETRLGMRHDKTHLSIHLLSMDVFIPKKHQNLHKRK